LKKIEDEAELAPLEEHILSCYHCAGRAEEAAGYADTERVALPEFPESTPYPWTSTQK
jgi:hypothetical protein